MRTVKKRQNRKPRRFTMKRQKGGEFRMEDIDENLRKIHDFLKHKKLTDNDLSQDITSLQSVRLWSAEKLQGDNKDIFQIMGTAKQEGTFVHLLNELEKNKTSEVLLLNGVDKFSINDIIELTNSTHPKHGQFKTLLQMTPQSEKRVDTSQMGVSLFYELLVCANLNEQRQEITEDMYLNMLEFYGIILKVAAGAYPELEPFCNHLIDDKDRQTSKFMQFLHDVGGNAVVKKGGGDNPCPGVFTDMEWNAWETSKGVSAQKESELTGLLQSAIKKHSIQINKVGHIVSETTVLTDAQENSLIESIISEMNIDKSTNQQLINDITSTVKKTNEYFKELNEETSPFSKTNSLKTGLITAFGTILFAGAGYQFSTADAKQKQFFIFMFNAFLMLYYPFKSILSFESKTSTSQLSKFILLFMLICVAALFLFCGWAAVYADQESAAWFCYAGTYTTDDELQGIYDRVHVGSLLSYETGDKNKIPSFVDIDKARGWAETHPESWKPYLDHFRRLKELEEERNALASGVEVPWYKRDFEGGKQTKKGKQKKRITLTKKFKKKKTQTRKTDIYKGGVDDEVVGIVFKEAGNAWLRAALNPVNLVKGILGSLGEGAGRGAAEKLEEPINALAKAPGLIADAIGDTGEVLQVAVKKGSDEVSNAISGGLGEISEVINDQLTELINAIKGVKAKGIIENPVGRILRIPLNLLNKLDASRKFIPFDLYSFNPESRGTINTMKTWARSFSHIADNLFPDSPGEFNWADGDVLLNSVTKVLINAKSVGGLFTNTNVTCGLLGGHALLQSIPYLTRIRKRIFPSREEKMSEKIDLGCLDQYYQSKLYNAMNKNFHSHLFETTAIFAARGGAIEAIANHDGQHPDSYAIEAIAWLAPPPPPNPIEVLANLV